MTHAVHGLDALWRNLPMREILYNPEDVAPGPRAGGPGARGAVAERTPLAQSGLCPLLLCNIGSAMSIVGVSDH